VSRASEWNGITSLQPESWERCAASFLKKGWQVYVDGELRTREIQANNDGSRHCTVIVASRVQFLTAVTTKMSETGALASQPCN
jgi:single-stranded DNA-binding protein